jgi:hypothetical protein
MRQGHSLPPIFASPGLRVQIMTAWRNLNSGKQGAGGFACPRAAQNGPWSPLNGAKIKRRLGSASPYAAESRATGGRSCAEPSASHANALILAPFGSSLPDFLFIHTSRGVKIQVEYNSNRNKLGDSACPCRSRSNPTVPKA